MNKQQRLKLTAEVKSLARELGFPFAGISRVRRLDEEEQRLEQWLKQGYHGSMQYMENHFELRLDPGQLVPGAKTVISLLYNYHNPQKQKDPDAPKISRYAYGTDYHFVLKRKLKTLLGTISEHVGSGVSGRCFVDSAPVLERVWAQLSGTGWIGKHTLLIHPRAGSYFFLSQLIIDLELEPDQPIKDFCGTCTRCIDACPTGAIAPGGYTLDGSKCISYLTIERKEEIPASFKGQMENWMFGCDICQQVCPWNRFSTPHHEPEFEPREGLLEKTRGEWLELTEDVFQSMFGKSAVKRTGYRGLMRNIRFLEQEGDQ